MYPYDNSPDYGPPQPYYQQQPQYNQFYQPIQQLQYQQPIQYEQKPVEVKDESIGLKFDFLKSDKAKLPIGPSIIDTSVDNKKKKKQPSKSKTENIDGVDVVLADGTVVNTNGDEVNNVVYADTYQETTGLLKSSIMDIDSMAAEIKQEMNSIRTSKTLKGKYTYYVNMANAYSALMSSRIGAIKEINSSIKNINDAEYRRHKDNIAFESGNDDKYISDMYAAFVSTKTTPASQFVPPPTPIEMTVGGYNMVPATAGNYEDIGYKNYLSNLTPEQNAMLLENNPDIKEVVVYDKASGNKYFQWRNVKTGETVSNMPDTDPMFLDDTSIDPVRKVATNINMNKTWPVVVLNDHMFSEY